MVQLLDAVEQLQALGVRSEIYSATSYGELRREGLACDRYNRLHPTEDAKQPWVEQVLGKGNVPVIAVSDNMAAVPDMIRQWVGGHYTVLGTDGFGRSDTREALRRFFEIDGKAIALAALSSLVRAGTIDGAVYAEAEMAFGISTERNDITEI